MSATAVPATAVEIEIASPQNRQYFFPPVGKPLRGRIDFSLSRTKTNEARRQVWPEVIPGMILGMSPDGKSMYLREPLYDEEHAKIRKKAEGKGQFLGEKLQEFQGHTPRTWAYWMARAVESGAARVVKGNLPTAESLEGPRQCPKHDERFPRKDFLFAPKERNPNELLAEAIAGLSELIGRLLAAQPNAAR